LFAGVRSPQTTNTGDEPERPSAGKHLEPGRRAPARRCCDACGL